MDNMVGRTFSVLEVHMSGQYCLDSAYGYWFLEESLELVKSDFVIKFLIGDKVTHKNFPEKVFTVWGLKDGRVQLKEPGTWVDAGDLSLVFEKGDPEMEKSQTAAAPSFPAIEHKTFIFGEDSDSVSDEDIFDHIFDLEGDYVKRAFQRVERESQAQGLKG